MESDRGRGQKGALEELMRERIRTTIEASSMRNWGRAGCGTIAAQRSGSGRLSAWEALANADHQSWPHHHRNAAGTP